MVEREEWLERVEGVVGLENRIERIERREIGEIREKECVDVSLPFQQLLLNLTTK
jgi:hypothetical protein